MLAKAATGGRPFVGIPMNDMPTDRVVVETSDAVGWITFNNPERRNAISEDMLAGLAAALAGLNDDPAVRAIVLRGAGDKAFIAGVDITRVDGQLVTDESQPRYRATLAAAIGALESSPKPTVAAIRGYCIGLGVNIALLCDLRIAGDDARFAIPGARIGNGYNWVSMKRLADTVGPAFAREIVLTGRQFDAAEAAAMGLINRVTAAAELEAFTRSYAGMIAGNAPLSMASAKATLRALHAPRGDLDRVESDRLFALCADSEDLREGRRAMMEKRKPVFRGR